MPLAPEKTEDSAMQITFLAIVIDSEHMQCRLPEDKVQNLRMVAHRSNGAKKIRLWKLQSLLGKLNSAYRIIPMGRFFDSA